MKGKFQKSSRKYFFVRTLIIPIFALEKENLLISVEKEIKFNYLMKVRERVKEKEKQRKIEKREGKQRRKRRKKDKERQRRKK